MKFTRFIALLFPIFAMAAEPRFEIPSDAYKSRGRCTVEKSTRAARGKGWTDWKNEKHSEVFDFTSWATADSLHTLEDHGGTLRHTETKNILENEIEIKRLEKVEIWVQKEGEWSVETQLLDVTIQHRWGSPHLRLERREDGRVFRWEASASPEGKITKNLLNPEVLNTKERQFGLLRTVCRQ